jgi:hypothetical protein
MLKTRYILGSAGARGNGAATSLPAGASQGGTVGSLSLPQQGGGGAAGASGGAAQPAEFMLLACDGLWDVLSNERVRHDRSLLCLSRVLGFT